MRRLVVNSGGIDSAVTLAEAARGNPSRVYSLFIDMGSRQNKRESDFAAMQTAFHLGVLYQHLEAKLVCGWLDNHSLFHPEVFIMSNESNYANRNSEVVDRAFVVPMRNLMILSVAVSFAASVRADEVWLGFDYRGKDKAASSPSWDKRPQFVEAFSRLVAECNEWGKIKFVTPLQGNNKAATIRRGTELGVNFSLTWSCYNNLPKHCGTCSACLQRKAGFAEAGIPDPTNYASDGMLRTYVDLG